MSNSPTLTFVCCIESGPLEFQTTRMVRSVRKWGGRFANAPIIAVTPRRGFPLHPRTVSILKNNAVEHVVRDIEDPFKWFGYLNKCKALEIAEGVADTDLLVWLDSDTLVVAEPADLLLEEGIDIAACPTSKTLATEGPEDANEPYWQELCDLFEVSLESLGWTTTIDKGERIRGYFNSGVVTYRRGLDFGAAYRSANLLALEHGPVHPEAGIFYLDQISLALEIARSKLRWRELSDTHNLTMRPHLEHPDASVIERTAIIHYRGSMWPDVWPGFIERISPWRPDVVSWLEELGPMSNGAKLHWRVGNKLLNKQRLAKRRQWESTR